MTREALQQGAKYTSLLGRLKRDQIMRLIQISLRNRYVFFAIPKNASSTVKHHLQNLEYQGTPFSASDKVHDRQASPLLATYQLPPDLLEEVLSSGAYRRIVVVRHPVGRLLSCYLDRIQDPRSTARRRVGEWLKVGIDAPVTLAQFVQAICEHGDGELEQHFKPQTDFIAHPDISMTHVIRFEHMREQLPGLLLELGARKPPSMDRNLSPAVTDADSRIAQHFDGELLRMVQQRYQGDMEAFGYEQVELSR